MPRRKGGPRPSLTFGHANAVCRELVPAGERIFEYADRLREAGFEAFVPRQEFDLSFCAGPEEARIHRQCEIETAKIGLGRGPWVWPTSPEETAQLYQSPFLQRLMAERDARNGVPETELGTRYPGEVWRYEFDPCARRKVYTEVRERQSYEPRWQAMLDDQRRIFEREVARHATGLARGHTFDKRGRFTFCKLAMERALAPLGFHFDAPKSFPDFPVFSKQVSENWDLCWALEDRASLYTNGLEGFFDPYLQIRGATFTGSIEKGKFGEFLVFQYQHIVPNFGVAYWEFFDLDELETVILAHAFLYGLIAPIVEGGLHKVLGGEPCGV